VDHQTLLHCKRIQLKPPAGSTLRASCARGTVTPQRPAPGASGRIDVPDSILEAGVVHVNAFVDPRAATMSPGFWLTSDDRYGAVSYLRDLGVEPPDDPSDLRELWDATITAKHRADVRASTLAAMVEAMSRVSIAIWGAQP
jgi:hypothetical protein